MSHKIQVGKFNKQRERAKSQNYRDWREEGCRSTCGLGESVYSTSNRKKAGKTILDEALEEDWVKSMRKFSKNANANNLQE